MNLGQVVVVYANLTQSAAGAKLQTQNLIMHKTSRKSLQDGGRSGSGSDSDSGVVLATKRQNAVGGQLRFFAS